MPRPKAAATKKRRHRSHSEDSSRSDDSVVQQALQAQSSQFGKGNTGVCSPWYERKGQQDAHVRSKMRKPPGHSHSPLSKSQVANVIVPPHATVTETKKRPTGGYFHVFDFSGKTDGKVCSKTGQPQHQLNNLRISKLRQWKMSSESSNVGTRR
eukprot:3180604-Amphidinium_carterae.1